MRHITITPHIFGQAGANPNRVCCEQEFLKAVVILIMLDVDQSSERLNDLEF